jgi:NAD(P)-dependent dehydrogenase (short-subunit alcohol dehydrogenase family)
VPHRWQQGEENAMAKDLEGRVAIVTGAAGGIGRVLVKAFAGRGVRIAACDIDAAALAAMEREYGRDRVAGFTLDISDPAACAATVQKVADHFGGVHILVNNGAVGMSEVRPDHFTRPVQIEDIEAKTWQRFMAVNLSGAFFLAKAAVPVFRKQRWGRIVNVTTSFFTMLNPGFSPYGPAKAGLEAWSASLAGELKGSGITVNVVVPGGPTDTPMVPVESGIDRAKLIRPERMAPPILWLCSDEAGDATGRRYIAAEWDDSVPPAVAARRSNPAAWPGLAQGVVWPSDEPPSLAGDAPSKG